MEFKLFVIILLVIVVQLGYNFYLSYAKKKGESLATKEDINKLTESIELVKQKFIHETEKLKIELNYKNQIRQSLANKKMESIENVFTKYVNWINIVFDSFNNSSNFNTKQLKNAQSNVNKSYLTFINSRSAFMLFVDSEELNQMISGLEKLAIKYEGLWEKFVLELELLIKREEEEISKLEFDNCSEELNNIVTEKINLYKSKHAEMMEVYKEIIKLNLYFRAQCMKLLSEDIDVN